MGALEVPDGGIGVDSSAGTIVWVRRRNGSWWPGKILGPDELSSHLMTPRSGTPVKLLGREDASVDWYNLEKSKRIKAFRCGEFDAFIERVGSSERVHVKKREKYARREDAILHALELEKKLLMKQQKLALLSNGICDKMAPKNERESNSFVEKEHVKMDDPQKHSESVVHKSQMITRKGSMSNDGGNVLDSILEEDSSALMPRMRGLQDFGLLIGSSKKKLSQSLASENCVTAVDNHADGISSSVPITGCGSSSARGKNFPAPRKKRSLVGMTEESLGKRRDRRRPLMKVLQNSCKLSISHPRQTDVTADSLKDGENDTIIVCRAKRSRCIYLPAGASNALDHFEADCKQSSVEPPCEIDPLADRCTSTGLVESDEFDASEIDFLEPNTKGDEILLTGLENPERLADHDPSAAQVVEKYGNPTDSEHLPNATSQFDPTEQAAETSVVGVSKWHMKGKRNIRNLCKRSMDVKDGNKLDIDECKCSIPVKESTHTTIDSDKLSKIGVSPPSCQEDTGHGFHQKRPVPSLKFAQNDNIQDNCSSPAVECDNHQSALPCSDLEGGLSNLDDRDKNSHLACEADGQHLVRRACSDASNRHPTRTDCPNHETGMGLLDVELETPAVPNDREHVPLVSLMSMLNQKTIIGHPVQIEVVEDGSTSAFVSIGGSGGAMGCQSASAPVWTTGRRTAMLRVPHSNPGQMGGPMAWEAEEKGESQGCPRFPVREAVSPRKNRNSRVLRTVSGKFQKKHSRKGSLLNPKTRALSSIGARRKMKGENRDVSGVFMKLKSTSITCVPAKVVFSRIMEAVGRPPSSVALRSAGE